uniref:Nuclear receptor domain-containing protein n=1 Tax=Panagrolaimus superbus TaxID=310955 RepID=A0A914YGB1_9BILA
MCSFFRRAVLSKNHYQCKIDKTCKILKDIRNLCKFCRYQKCIDKGMLPSLVQGNRDSYGKRSAFIVSPLSKTLKENCKEEMKILPKMLNGYLKFQNLRKESCILLVGEKVFENWNPKVIPHSKYSSAKIIMQTVTKLAHDMIMEYFIPFSSFEPGDMKMLFEKFAVLFDNAEKSYNTFKAYGHIKNNENVILADGGYINLDETHKFFANSMDANVEPQQLAK